MRQRKVSIAMHVAVFIGERVIWAIIAVLMPFILLVVDMQAGGPMQYLLSSRMISRQLAEVFQSPLGLPIIGAYFAGMILLGPPIWNRIRTRGREKLAEVKAESHTALKPLQDAHLRPEAGGSPLPMREPLARVDGNADDEDTKSNFKLNR